MLCLSKTLSYIFHPLNHRKAKLFGPIIPLYHKVSINAAKHVCTLRYLSPEWTFTSDVYPHYCSYRNSILLWWIFRHYKFFSYIKTSEKKWVGCLKLLLIDISKPVPYHLPEKKINETPINTVNKLIFITKRNFVETKFSANIAVIASKLTQNWEPS